MRYIVYCGLRFLILCIVLYLIQIAMPKLRHFIMLPLHNDNESIDDIHVSPTYDHVNYNDAGGCHIPDFDPFDPKYKHLFHKVERPACSDLPPITHLQEFGNTAEIVIEMMVAFEKYQASWDFTCCYQEISRQDSWVFMRDHKIKKSQCFPMEVYTQLPETTEFIIVTCKNPAQGGKKEKVFYKNAHALLPDKGSVNNRLALNHNYINPVSILMVGIDSMSRINLKRTMPNTAKYFSDNGWIELLGYNKIADHTYTNHMAILTGYNSTDAYAICAPTTLHGLKECPIIWRRFQSSGYTTAYGEDRPEINAFNYQKRGFSEQPTDYYMRPFFLAMREHMPPDHENNFKKNLCTGPVSAALRIFGYASAFTSKFNNDPFFALFWLNSFSHEDVNLPSAMDKTMLIYLDSLFQSDVLDTSIIFFFSNYGLRHDIKNEMASSFYEERLPFFYAWFPAWFRDKYPELVKNFEENSDRLTTPYDFHLTLQHLLSLYDPEREVTIGTRGCPKCVSLMKPISSLRTCQDASIEPRWCACSRNNGASFG